jgi:hypothetical protein
VRFCRSGGISNRSAALSMTFFVGNGLNSAKMFGALADDIDVPAGHQPKRLTSIERSSGLPPTMRYLSFFFIDRDYG